MGFSLAPAAPLVAPAASSPPALSWGGSAWVSGSWVEVLASAGVASALCSVSVKQADPTPFSRFEEIDIGVGAAGAEVVIASLKWVSGNRFGGPAQFYLPVPIASIPAGGRVAARLRQSSSASTAVSIGYVATGDGFTTTTKPLKVSPAAANSVAITHPGTAWDWSSWTEIEASTSAAWVLAGCGVSNNSNLSSEWEAEVGVGAASAEVAVARIAGRGGLSTGGPRALSFLPIPMTGAIASGVRVSMRVRGNVDPAELSYAHLYYYEAPL